MMYAQVGSGVQARDPCVTCGCYVVVFTTFLAAKA